MASETRRDKFEVRKVRAGLYYVFDTSTGSSLYNIEKLTNTRIIEDGLKWRTEHVQTKDYGHHKTLKLAVEAIMAGWI